MKKISKPFRPSQGSPLGRAAFAAITAVEGLKLSASGKARFKASKNLTLDERRNEIIQAYMSLDRR